MKVFILRPSIEDSNRTSCPPSSLEVTLQLQTSWALTRYDTSPSIHKFSAPRSSYSVFASYNCTLDYIPQRLAHSGSMPGFASTAFFSFSMVAPSTPSVWRMTDIGSLKKVGMMACMPPSRCGKDSITCAGSQPRFWPKCIRPLGMVMDWPAFSTEDNSRPPFSSTRPHSISPACYPSSRKHPNMKIQDHPGPIAGAQPSGQMFRPSRVRLRLSASLSRSHSQKGLVTDDMRTFGYFPLPHA
jgi:hypothetical protein